MERERTVGAARSLIAAVALTWAGACEGGLFAYHDHELVDCWPACADAGETGDAGEAGDAGEGHDAGSGHDAGDGVDAATEELLPLEVLYHTTNSITWTWPAEALEGEVMGYNLRFSTDVELVRSGGGDEWGATDDGNLAYRVSPHGPGTVNRTTVTGLGAATTYHARLYAHFSGVGPVAVAEGSGATLPEPAGRLVIFEEELPAEAVRVNFQPPETAGHALEGTRALWLYAEGGAWQESIVRELGINVEEIGAERWELGFLEYYVDLDFAGETLPVYFIETSLGGALAHTFVHEYTALPARAGWHRVQIPLRALLSEGAAPCTVAGLGGLVDSLGLAAAWPNDSVVFVDEISIRY